LLEGVGIAHLKVGLAPSRSYFSRWRQLQSGEREVYIKHLDILDFTEIGSVGVGDTNNKFLGEAMNTTKINLFKQFLREELAIPISAIALAERRSEDSPNLFGMVLWQYGLVTTQQLERIWDWMATA
jgi:hypothetical protein